MKDFLKERARLFISDKVAWGTSLLNTILCGCMGYFYIELEKRSVIPLLYLGFFFSYPVIVFFFGRKSIPVLYLVFSAGAVQDITYINATIFLMLLSVSSLYPKLYIPISVGYIIEVVIVCERHGKTVVHLLFHIAFCLSLAIGFALLNEYHKKRIIEESKMVSQNGRLDLEPDEELLLHEIVINNKMLKEIEGYKQNTISKKLKKIRTKNNCSTNGELYKKYKAQSESTSGQ